MKSKLLLFKLTTDLICYMHHVVVHGLDAIRLDAFFLDIRFLRYVVLLLT